MTGKPKIELRGVKKRFGPKVVLDGIDLVVNEGDSLVIIGGSGSGKSVTIKCVLGIIRPDAGTNPHRHSTGLEEQFVHSCV